MLRTPAPLIGALGFIKRMGAYHYIESYVHGNRIGAIVHLTHDDASTAKTQEFSALAEDLAKQIVALSPKVVRSSDLAPEIRDRELAYLLSRLDGLSPTERADRIYRANRRLNADFCLMEQLHF